MVSEEDKLSFDLSSVFIVSCVASIACVYDRGTQAPTTTTSYW